MKRGGRTVDALSKMRRSNKNRRPDGMMNSGIAVYAKLVIAWACLMLADQWIGFRFEYLYPAWLLMRSIYDSFRYQGFAFSMFFVTITITSDLVCFLFIPVQWLLFLASTYVWLQYIWHTDRGICLPTIALCFAFVAFEVMHRYKELAAIFAARSEVPLPFTLDLCRPFAAHCIGYPVVTMGVCAKTYVGFRYMQRKQREIAKENEVHSRLLTEALPATYYPRPPPSVVANGAGDKAAVRNGNTLAINYGDEITRQDTSSDGMTAGGRLSQFLPNGSAVVGSAAWLSNLKTKVFGDSAGDADTSTRNSDDEDDVSDIASNSTQSKKVKKTSDQSPRQQTSNPRRTREANNNSHQQHNNAKEMYNSVDFDGASDVERQLMQSNAHLAKTNERIRLLELEVDRFKNEARVAKLGETDARTQLTTSTTGEKTSMRDANMWKSKVEQLENKLQNERRSRDQEKHTSQSLEKRFVEEQRMRLSAESALERERRASKRVDDARPAGERRIVTECGEVCRQRRRDMDNEMKQIRREMTTRDDEMGVKETELMQLRNYRESNNMEGLVVALQGLKEKNMHLEKSLRAENQLKQDLFSALGEAKQQIDTYKNELRRKNDDNMCNLMRGGGRNGETNNVNGMGTTHTLNGGGPAFGGSIVGGPLGLGGLGTRNDVAPQTNHTDDLLTNAIYNGVAAYLTSSGPSGQSPINVPDDSFEDATTELANSNSRQHMTFTPPRV